MTYVPPSISNYNSSPPSDDGSQTTSNKITWASIKTKLADPVKNYADALNTAIADGFNGLFLSDVSDKSTNFSVGTTDDGLFFNCTSNLTATLPPAADAGEGFHVLFFNNSTGTIIIDGNGSETINAATTFSSFSRYDAIVCVCTGTAWFAFRVLTNQGSEKEQTIASAATTDIGSLGCANVIISGTTTITALGSSASADFPLYYVRFTGALTLTHNGTSLIIPGSANITTANGDSMVALYLGSGNWKVLSFSKISGKSVITSVATSDLPNGCVIQVVGNQTGAVATGTTQIPWDDTIPQNTEGDQYLSQAITPTRTTSILKIDVTVNISNGSQNQGSVALFQDSNANALAAASQYLATTLGDMRITFSHYMISGTTSSTTFKVRAGFQGAGTTTLNGQGGARKFGGVAVSSIIITEYAA